MDDPHRIPAPGERRRFGPPWPEEPGRSPRPLFAFPDDLRALARAVLALLWLSSLALAFAGARAWLTGPRAGLRPRLAAWFRRRASRDLLRLAGVRLSVSGRLPESPSLIVANHLSWLDAFLVLAVAAPAPVTLERGIPFYSRAARALGCEVIRRNDASGLRPAIDALAAALARGESATFFPEGTTGFGRELKGFRSPFFQAAVDSGTPVACASIAYRVPPPAPSPERSVAWVDWTPLALHAWRLLGLPRVEARIRFGAILPPPTSRKQARDAAQAEVARLIS